MSDVEKTQPEATTSEHEELMTAIAERVIAAGGVFNEAQTREMIRAELQAVATDPEFVRKIRHGGEPEYNGSKFRGLTDADIDYLGTLVMAERGQYRQRLGGPAPGPSPELAAAFEDARPRAEKDVDPGYASVLDDTRKGRVMDPGDSHVRAMDTAQTGYGLELMGAQYSGSLWEAARRTSRVWPLINSFPMASQSVYLPVEVNFPTVYKVGESTATNATNYTTSLTGSQVVNVTAVKFAMHQMYSGEMEEDSIIPYVPFLRNQAVKSLAWHQDALVLRGDTTTTASTNINDIDGTPTTDAYGSDYFLAWDGIIHAALVDYTTLAIDASGAPTWEDLMAMKGKMIDRTYFHDWGHPSNPSDLVYVAEPATADTVALLDEVLTVNNYGAQATVLSGELGSIMRHPLIVCDSLPLTEATGKIDKTVSDNTKGILVAFNRNGYVLGIRRALKVETERIIATDQTRIVHTARWGFTRFSATGAASGIRSASVLYDITV